MAILPLSLSPPLLLPPVGVASVWDVVDELDVPVESVGGIGAAVEVEVLVMSITEVPSGPDGVIVMICCVCPVVEVGTVKMVGVVG
jgi:hypothetical protein